MPFFCIIPVGDLRKTNVMAKYTQDSHISTAEEVHDFFRHIVFDLDINFHPDDDFADYIDTKTSCRIMDDDEAALYNRLMDEAFEVFDDEDAIYEMACDLLNERLTTNKE